MRKKWLINVSEEPDMINTTLDNGRSLRQLVIGVSFSLAFQAIRKSLKYVATCIVGTFEFENFYYQ